jgi:translation initiation factor 1
MAKNSNSEIVYSTNPDFVFEDEGSIERETVPPEKQKLKILLDKKQRKGKKVTLVKGFSGAENDLKELGKALKSYCGTGGSVKNGEIIIQGDFREKIKKYLESLKYRVQI